VDDIGEALSELRVGALVNAGGKKRPESGADLAQLAPGVVERGSG
jgi:hypothetical protein